MTCCVTKLNYFQILEHENEFTLLKRPPVTVFKFTNNLEKINDYDFFMKTKLESVA